MKRYGRRLVLVSIALHLLVFAGGILYAYLMFEEKRLLLSFRMPWVTREALILFCGFFIPVQITAVVIAYGLGTKKEEAEFLALNPFHHIIKPAMIFFIIITAVFSTLREGVVPGAHEHQQAMLYRTKTARNLIEKSDAARAEGEYREAFNYLEEYLDIDPENREQIQAQNELMDRIIEDRKNEQAQDEAPAEAVKKIKPGMTAGEFMEEAGTFFDEGDYFSAHYYATLAYSTDPSRTDADRLAKRAWRMINEITPSPLETERYELHLQKKKGFEALTAGHALEAYYLFTRLIKDYPLDPDIDTYLEESKQAVKNISFFSDELEKTTAFPGTGDIVFLNSHDEDNREIIFIGKLVSIREGYYLFNVEVLAFDRNGETAYHLKAPYGKIINNNSHDRIVTLCIDRENESAFYSAQYLAGGRSEAERNIIPLNIGVDMMENFSAEKGFLSRISLPYLWNLGKVYADYGMRKEIVDIEMLDRLMKPFALLLFSFLTLALSWSLRPVSGRPGFLAYPLILLIPLVAHGVLTLYYYAARLLNSFLLLTLGFAASLAAVILVQGLFLTLVFIYLAGQSTE